MPSPKATGSSSSDSDSQCDSNESDESSDASTDAEEDRPKSRVMADRRPSWHQNTQAQVRRKAEEANPAELTPQQLRRSLKTRQVLQATSRDHIKLILQEAPRRQLQPGEQFHLKDGEPLVLVEKGAVDVSIGEGTPSTFGPGTCWNQVGWLNATREAEPYRPKPNLKDSSGVYEPKGRKGPYEIYARSSLIPPSIFSERRSGSVPSNDATDDRNCFFCLCPMAASRAKPSEDAPAGWQNVKMVGSPPSKVPSSPPNQCSSAYVGGATLVLIPMELIEKIGLAVGPPSPDALSLRLSLAAFHQKRATSTDLWRSVMSRFCKVFPGVHPQILWFLSEETKVKQYEIGDILCHEGDPGEAIIMIDDGDVLVEKSVCRRGEIQVVAIGCLGPSAIIGDLGYVGTGMTRAAQMRAKTRVEVLEIPAGIILELIELFPGFVGSMKHMVREIASCIQNKVPSKAATLRSMELFSGISYSTLVTLGSRGEREWYPAGEAILNPSKLDQGSLYIVEFGACIAQKNETGTFQRMTAGHCFAGKTVLGFSSCLGSSVRVATAFAVILVIKDKWLQEAVGKMDMDGEGYFSKAAELSRGVQPHKFLTCLDIFSICSDKFVKTLYSYACCRSYMPGQTLAVQGGKDVRCVVIVGGSAMLKKVAQIQTDEVSVNSFGELAMLGATHTHTGTVRAASVVFTVEIYRENFAQVVGAFPEDGARFEDYAIKSIENGAAEESNTTWPFMPEKRNVRLLHLIDFHAGRTTFEPGEETPGKDYGETAVLVINGIADVFRQKEDGEVQYIRELRSGMCFNEAFLLGVDCTHDDQYVVPRTTCELQMLSFTLFKKLMKDFPDEKETVQKNILKCIASQAADDLGCELSSPAILQMSKLFTMFSQECVEQMAPFLDTITYFPDQEICFAKTSAAEMTIVLSGVIAIEDGSQFPPMLGPSSVYGEAMVLGIVNMHPYTLRAQTLSVVQQARKKITIELIKRFEDDARRFEPILKEGKKMEGLRLSYPLMLSGLEMFSRSDAGFLKTLCQHAEDIFLAPGEVFITFGEECRCGESPLFVIVAGKAVIENEFGMMQNILTRGDLAGEGGALGFAPTRMSTVRIFGDTCGHVAKMHGRCVKDALNEHPEEYETFAAVISQRHEMNERFVKKREKWFAETVLPAFREVPLFPRNDAFFICLASSLVETSYKAGEILAVVGKIDENMVIILSGVVESLSQKDGRSLGQMGAGSIFGETAGLGLSNWNMSNIRAVTDTKVLKIHKSILQDACEKDPEGTATKHIMGKKEKRTQQIASALPMTALPINISPENMCAQALAMQAEPCSLKVGQILLPRPVSHPAGPFYLILVSGRAVLEICGRRSKTVQVMPIFAGYLLIETLASEYGMILRAVLPCEVSRIRLFDFESTVSAVPCSQEWTARFQVLEGDCRQQLTQRADAAVGVQASGQIHVNDADIHRWRERKNVAIHRAKLPPIPYSCSRGGDDSSTEGSVRCPKTPLLPAINSSPTVPHASLLKKSSSTPIFKSKKQADEVRNLKFSSLLAGLSLSPSKARFVRKQK